MPRSHTGNKRATPTGDIPVVGAGPDVYRVTCDLPTGASSQEAGGSRRIFNLGRRGSDSPPVIGSARSRGL